MKNLSQIICFILLALNGTVSGSNYYVTNVSEINTVLAAIQPGDTVTMKNQVWMNANIIFSANGTEQDSVYLRAETPGMVRLSGTSNLRIGGSFIVVEGLYFINGYSPSGAVIEFRKNSSSESSHCRLTNTGIVDYNPPSNSTDYKWISLYGSNNRVDHCYLRGKNHAGTTLVVWLSENPNYHIIDNNYFAYRPPLGVNGGETIRVGTSDWSMYNSYTIVENNYFEECDGEAEIISNKSCENIYRNNTFVKCSGALTLRHGNRCTVENNYFLGGKKSGSGGVRIIGEDHKVFNNYFFELAGSGIRSAISIMNGIPESPLNGYYQVKNAVVAFNTFVNCYNNFNIGTGASTTQSLPPENCTIANNLVKGVLSPLIKYESQPINLVYEGNIMYGADLGITASPGITLTDPVIELSDDGLYRIQDNSPALNNSAGEFVYVTDDMDGQSRTGIKDIGADEYSTDVVINRPLKPEESGPSWLDIILRGAIVVSIESGSNTLYDAVINAQPYSVIELQPGIYTNNSTIILDKNLVIRAVLGSQTRPIIQNTGSAGSTLFKISGNSVINLEGIELDGLSGSTTPAKYLITSTQNSTDTYRLIVNDCSFKNVDSSVFYAYPGTTADSVKFINSLFTASGGSGIRMDAETLNSGKFNVKYFEARNSTFWNISAAGISIYGGDENSSTISPKVKVNHCTFNKVGINTSTILNFKDSDGAEIVSSIFSNSLSDDASIIISGLTSKIHYCDTFNVGPIVLERGAVKGSGMMGSDPLYADADAGNFMLSGNSPLLNKAYDFYSMGDLRWDPNVSYNSEETILNDFALLQNYPNPFNPNTKIVFTLRNSGLVNLAVYDINGSLVDLLLNEQLGAGIHKYSWNPYSLSSGVYFCRLITENKIFSIKMVYMK